MKKNQVVKKLYQKKLPKQYLKPKNQHLMKIQMEKEMLMRIVK